MRLTFLAVLGLGLVASQRYAESATYYVSNSGNDANSGTSAASPFRTLTHINAMSFAPGDSILLDVNSTWNNNATTGSYLSPCQSTRCSGTSTQLITIDQYGTPIDPTGHPHPKIVGDGASNSIVYFLNQSYWEVRHLDVSNAGPSGDIYGIHAVCDSTVAEVCSHIYIGYNTVHDINGTSNSMVDAAINVAANFHNWKYRTVCPKGVCQQLPITFPNRWDQITIEYNALSHINDTGIIITEANWTSDLYCTSDTFDCANSKPKNTNVLVNHNSVYDVTGNGIVVGLSTGSVLQYNTVGLWGNGDSAGAAGLWSFATVNTTIQYNEVYDGQSGTDRTAFDLDWGNISTYIQYNYSHHNAGGMLLLIETYGWTGSTSTYIDDPIVRFNISYDDGAPGAAVINVCGRWSAGANPPDIENNTIYQSQFNYATGTYNNVEVFGVCGTSNPLSCSGSPITGTAYVYNNIVDVENATSWPTFQSATIFSSNNFFAPWYGSTRPPCEPIDATVTYLDPQFVSGTAPTLGMKLKSTSPDLTNGYLSAYLGPVDYFSNAVSTTVAPNRGAYDGPGL